MSIEIVKKEEGDEREISESYQVKNFITKESSEKVSLAVSEADEHSETTKNVRSDRIYYVLEGKLVIKDDKGKYTAEPGDVIYIPKDTKYHFKGTFKAVLINSPAFDPEDEKIAEL